VVLALAIRTASAVVKCCSVSPTKPPRTIAAPRPS